MRKNLYIIGARSFGRDFVGFCRQTPGLLDQYRHVGFLDDKADALSGYDDYPPIIGSVESYMPRESDVFFCAMGNVPFRVKYTEMMIDRGGKFDTFISLSAKIHPNSEIGSGVFIWDNVVVGADAKIHDHVICQSNVIIGHDVVIGEYTIIDTFVACCGFAKIGSRTALHTGAKIAPQVSVGSGVMAGIGSVIIRDIPNGVSVFGNPARAVVAPKVME